MEFQELKTLLDEYVGKINVPSFIEQDPVQFPRRYTLLQDQEVAGLLTAIISWGKRSAILRSADRMLAVMGASPYDYIMEADFEKKDPHSLHRTFNYEDFLFLCKGLRELYLHQDSMENLFVNKDLFDGIQTLRDTIISANGIDRHHAEKHLSSPAKNSACKRLHMFLRWMVRNDGIVDIGCWKQVSPSALYIPIDVHVSNISRMLGMLDRKQNDRKAVEMLTAELRRFNPEDPIKYDFALFGIGEGKLI